MEFGERHTGVKVPGDTFSEKRSSREQEKMKYTCEDSALRIRYF